MEREDRCGAAGQPDVSIIVVSYNTRAMTLACLASVAAETRAAHEVIVLDNASTDGSAEAVAAAFPAVRLIRLARNIGFGPGNNRAAAEARGRHLLLLNPDTVILDRAIDRLLDFAAARPAAGIWGGRTVFADGTLNATSCFAQVTPLSLTLWALGLQAFASGSALLNREGYGGWARDSERAVDIVTGCFLLITRALWDRLGGFDEDFFMYAEEADLCLRAAALGARPRVTPVASIVHHGGGSEPVAAVRTEKVLRGKLTLVAKHWRAPARAYARGLFRVAVLLRAVGYAIAARLTGRESHRASAREWGAVWQSRAGWIEGWPRRRPGDRRPAAQGPGSAAR